MIHGYVKTHFNSSVSKWNDTATQFRHHSSMSYPDSAPALSNNAMSILYSDKTLYTFKTENKHKNKTKHKTQNTFQFAIIFNKRNGML